MPRAAIAQGFLLAMSVLFAAADPLTAQSSLSGRVVDHTTGHGVGSLVVRLSPPTALQRPDVITSTDSNGAFHLPSLPEGRYLLTVLQGLTPLYRAEIYVRGQSQKLISLERLEDAILSLLERYRTRSKFYIRPNIPIDKLNIARARAVVPPDEPVLALLDATLTGTADLALVFCSNGIFYRTRGGTHDAPRQGRVLYVDFPGISFERQGSFSAVSLGPGKSFDIGGSGFSAEALLELLNSIKALLTQQS
jgi:hypothetical protein